MRKRYSIILVLLFGLIRSAQAEPDKSFSILVGAASSASQDRGHLKDPFAMQMDYFRPWGPLFSIGGTGGFFISDKYERKNQNDPIDPDAHVEAEGSGLTCFLGTQVKLGYAWDISRRVKIHPYGLIGMAMYAVYFSGSPPPETQEHDIHVQGGYGGFNYGGGLSFIFDETFGLGGDFRRHQLYRSREIVTTYDVASIQFMFRF